MSEMMEAAKALVDAPNDGGLIMDFHELLLGHVLTGWQSVPSAATYAVVARLLVSGKVSEADVRDAAKGEG